jgi:hypothetical protein
MLLEWPADLPNESVNFFQASVVQHFGACFSIHLNRSGRLNPTSSNFSCKKVIHYLSPTSHHQLVGFGNLHRHGVFSCCIFDHIIDMKTTREVLGKGTIWLGFLLPSLFIPPFLSTSLLTLSLHDNSP